MNPRTAWLVATVWLCALSACASTPAPAPAAHPAGHGWYCFTPHPAGTLNPSCLRTRDECVRALADAVNAERGEIERPAYASCAERATAHCFTYTTGASANGTPGFTCLASAEACERERTEVWPASLAIGPRCEAWE